MYYERIEKILRWIIIGSLYLIVFAPLILNADYFFPAIFLKAVYIRLLAELALVAFIPLIIIAPKYRPKFHIVYLSMAIFALVVLITSITGENFSYSMWGNYERMDGIFSWVHYWFLIVIAASVLKTKLDWLRLFGVSLIAAVLMSGYGFLQKAGVNSFGPLTIYETNLDRITGTIGNPAFLAVYLLFNVTFGLIIATSKKIALHWRLASIVALLVTLSAYMMTGARGAFVGLIAGILFFSVASIFVLGSKKLKIISIVFIIGILMLLVSVFAFRSNEAFRQMPFFGRLATISLTDSTVQTRIISWKSGFRGGLDNFWLGVGPQKFDAIFNKNFDPAFYTLVGSETWWDRAHNMVLESFSTMGIFGLLSYLGVGFALLYALWRIWHKEKSAHIEILIIVSFLIGYFIQNLFVFDTISSYIMLVVMMGYIIARTSQHPTVPKHINLFFSRIKIYYYKIFQNTLPVYWIPGLVVSLLVVVPIGYVYNVKLIYHNRLFLDTIARPGQTLQGTLNNFRDVLEISDFDKREVAIKLGQFIGQHALSTSMSVDELQRSYRFVMNTMEEAIREKPKDVRLILSYGNTMNVYGETIREHDKDESERVLRKAENALKEAIELGPRRQQVFHSLANTYLIQGHGDKAVQVLKDAISVHEDSPTSHWILAVVYIRIDEKQLALASAESALNKGYKITTEQEMVPILELYIELKEYEKLIRIYRNVAGEQSTDSDYARIKAKEAAIHAQLGNKEEAIKAANEVRRTDPSLYGEVNDFINTVEAGGEADFVHLR